MSSPIPTAPELRDRLLKHAADRPRAVVVELAELAVHHATELADSTLPRSVPVYPSVERSVAAIGDPPPQRRARRRFPASLECAGDARWSVFDTCADWPSPRGCQARADGGGHGARDARSPDRRAGAGDEP